MNKTITSFQKQGKRSPQIIVSLDGVVWATLDPETVVRERLHTGQALDETRRAQIMASDEAIRARKAAAGHAARNPKTRQELELYLRRRRFSARAIEAALAMLDESGTVDDERVTAWFIRSRRQRRDIGPRRLEAELRTRGIPAQTAEERVSEALAQTDLAAECKTLACRVAKRYEPLTKLAQRRKLAAFLQRRGYAAEQVWPAIRALRAESEEPWEEGEED